MSKHKIGLDGRTRDQNGQIHHKRSDTKIGTLRETYGADFAGDARNDMKLGTLLKKENEASLSQLLKD